MKYSRQLQGFRSRDAVNRARVNRLFTRTGRNLAMGMSELHYLELLDVANLIQTRKVSSVEVTQAQLDRIAALDGRLRSYVTPMPEQAIAAATAADAEIAQGDIRGPLHGVPIGIKDLCWTHDAPTAAGMPLHAGYRPSEDATVVKRLRAAGAVVLGKLQLTEGAYADHHPDIAPPVNPWHPDHWPGVSSSGSGVATAAGLCYGSLGSDTGGSIRFPSAANGLSGLKPTWGRVSRYGCFELAATLDHIGPMARSAADAGAMLGIIAGADAMDPTASLDAVPNYLAGMTRGLEGLRIGIDHDWNSRVDDATAEMLRSVIGVLSDMGADLREVSFPESAPMLEDWFPLCGIEVAVAHAETYPAQADAYGPGLKGLIELGRAQSAQDYQRIILRRLDFTGRVRALMNTVDLLLIPTTAMASPTNATMATLGQDAELIAGLLRFTCPFDMSGSPTITLPAGFTEQGTPIAFQFVAPHFREELLVRAGWAFQQATDWHRRHPAL
jgi:amidase